MNLGEAYLLLQQAPQDDLPSNVNPNLTRAQAVKMVMEAIGVKTVDCNGNLLPLFEKRVRQVCQDRRRPK